MQYAAFLTPLAGRAKIITKSHNPKVPVILLYEDQQSFFWQEKQLTFINKTTERTKKCKQCRASAGPSTAATGSNTKLRGKQTRRPNQGPQNGEPIKAHSFVEIHLLTSDTFITMP